VNSLKRWHDLVFEVLETAFAQNTHILTFLYQNLQTSSALAHEVPFRNSLSYSSIFPELLSLNYKNKKHVFRSAIDIRPNYITTYPNIVSKIGYRYPGMGNSFTSLHVEYLLGETTVQEIVRDCCNSIWKCLKATEMPEKMEDYWVNTAKDFYQRTQFPTALVLWMGNMLE